MEWVLVFFSIKLSESRLTYSLHTWSRIRHSLREPLAEWLGLSTQVQRYTEKTGSHVCGRRQPLQ